MSKRNATDFSDIRVRRELLDQANARTSLEKIVARNARGDEARIRSFAGAALTYPQAHTGLGTIQISWHLLKRVADGVTSEILA